MIDGVCIITGFLGFVACKYKRIEQWQKSFAGKNHWLFKFLRVKLIIQLAPVWCVSLLRTMCFLRSVFHECFPYRAMWLQRSVQVGHVSVLIQSVGHVGHAFYTEWAVCFIQSVGHVFYTECGPCVLSVLECGPCVLYRRVWAMYFIQSVVHAFVQYRVWSMCFLQSVGCMFYSVWAICFLQSVGHMFYTECRPYVFHRVQAICFIQSEPPYVSHKVWAMCSIHMPFYTECGPYVSYNESVGHVFYTYAGFTQSVGHMFYTESVWAECGPYAADQSVSVNVSFE